MSRFLMATCCLLLFIQCTDKEVLLPVVSVDGIDGTENHSSIWIFFEASGGDTLAILNKNNKLINTNWIFNVDRRLKMKHVIPHFEALQRDRNKDSMHKKEGMKNFFSYADKKNERISLVDFPELEFVLYTGLNEPGAERRDSICLVPLTLSGEKIKVGEREFLVDQVDQIRETLQTCNSSSQARFELHYSGNLTYQNYLRARASLASLTLPLDNTEFIHTLK